MFLSCAEHDGFLHPVSTLEVFRDFTGYLKGALFQNDIVIEIAIGIDSIFNLISVFVELAFVGTPAFTNVGANIDYLKRSKEAILDALSQAVCINRVTKVIDIGDVLGFLGRCSQTDLRSEREVFQDLAPVTVFLCGATMTLVNDNQVKEILLE